MIDTALDFLTKEVNAHLNLLAGEEDTEYIVMANVADDQGHLLTTKKLGLSLINIEEERIFKEQKTSFMGDNGETLHYNPEIKLNLYILITANWEKEPTDYKEGLKQISRVISFFQSKNVFTNDTSPLLATIDETLKKLVVELHSFSFEEMWNFWSAIGAEYVPSVLYKVRLLKFQEKRAQDQLPVITSLQTDESTI